MDKKIKNLLFDLGGVIMDLKRERCVEALTALGMVGVDEMLGLYKQSGAFLDLEEGVISPDEFHAIIKSKIPTPVTDAQVDDAFNQFLVGIPAHRLALLRELRKDYKIFLLSNTNAIMWDSKIKECFKVEGRQVNDYFDGFVLSYEAKAAKPDKKIYQFTLDSLGIEAEETLFFDDSQANLDSAAEMGFNTYLVAPGKEFADAFNK